MSVHVSHDDHQRKTLRNSQSYCELNISNFLMKNKNIPCQENLWADYKVFGGQTFFFLCQLRFHPSSIFSTFDLNQDRMSTTSYLTFFTRRKDDFRSIELRSLGLPCFHESSTEKVGFSDKFGRIRHKHKWGSLKHLIYGKLILDWSFGLRGGWVFV